MVGLVAQLLQPASNWVETVENALVATAFVFSGSNRSFSLSRNKKINQKLSSAKSYEIGML